MRNHNKLLIEQLDRKLEPFYRVRNIQIPQRGWVHTIRTSLNMTLKQLGNRLEITSQGVKDIEERESTSSISIKSLKEVAKALDMQFVYAFVPKENSIEKLVELKARELATKIAQRTSHNMKLENQWNMEGLLIKTITTHGELDEHEQLNIKKAIEWIIRTKFKQSEILTEEFIKKVHAKMFDGVWKWAGEYRKSEIKNCTKSIRIGIELRSLLNDTRYWIQNEIYSSDEIAIRFKYRLVSIHCFSNGNGRHSRIMADIIIESIFNENIFSWNRSNMIKPDKTRKKYISALMDADNGNIEPLIEFARN